MVKIDNRNRPARQIRLHRLKSDVPLLHEKGAEAVIKTQFIRHKPFVVNSKTKTRYVVRAHRLVELPLLKIPEHFKCREIQP